MQRNKSLFPLILRRLEESTRPVQASELKIHGYTSETISYHCGLLMDDGQIEAVKEQNNRMAFADYKVIKITSAGHDYLDALPS